MSDPITGRKPAILCVDGDAGALEAYEMLGAGEYEVTLVMTARDALRELNSRAFDAFVLEYWVDGWTGPSLCREIRENDPHVPIVCCSASAGDRDRLRMLRAGANDHVPKPVGYELSRVLRGLLAHAASASAAARAAAEAAAGADFERRLERSRDGLPTAFNGVERTARNRALEAFLRTRGTRAHFERCWPDILRRTEEMVSTRAFAPTPGAPAQKQHGL